MYILTSLAAVRISSVSQISEWNYQTWKRQLWLVNIQSFCVVTGYEATGIFDPR